MCDSSANQAVTTKKLGFRINKGCLMFAMDSAVACDSQIFCPVYDIVVLWFVFNQPFSLACQRDKKFVIAEILFFISVVRRIYGIGE